MKLVSSLVALAIAIAPLSSAMAKPTHHKPAAAKHQKKADAEKSDKAAPPVVKVKANAKDARAKKAVHHAHNADMSGAGHKEPKVEGGASGGNDHGGAIVSASMKSPGPAHPHKAHGAKPVAANKDIPKLPNPNAGKPSKGGNEKGARKGAEKKNEQSSNNDSSNDGEQSRDEELAELVARIRGLKPISAPFSGSEKETHNADSKDASKDKDKDKSKSSSSPMNTKPIPMPCAKDPVEIVRGPEIERFELTKCDGSVAPLAVEHLSIMIRPGGTARPTAPLADLAKKVGSDLAHGIKRVDPRLVERMQLLADHFSKPGAPAKFFVISGYRPASVGSMHSTGRAIDFRVEGVKNEDVVTFCKTLNDTGCGFYPNSSFVHVDVRDPGAGHVSWIDASGPGETPRYVPSWPPPPVAERHIRRASATFEVTPNNKDEKSLAEEGESLLRARRETSPDPVDDHPAEVGSGSHPDVHPAH